MLGERAAARIARRAAGHGPPALAPGFRAQARDERRHAALDATRLRLLGVDPATAAVITPGVAREVAQSDPDPMRDVFASAFVGESVLAGATFPFVIALAESNRDAVSATLERSRLADERRHVRFATTAFEILVSQDPANREVLQRWQDEQFARGASAFLSEVAPWLERAPNRPEGDWLGGALAVYRARALRLGLRGP